MISHSKWSQDNLKVHQHSKKGRNLWEAGWEVLRRLTTVSLFRVSRANNFCHKGRNKGTKITLGIDTEYSCYSRCWQPWDDFHPWTTQIHLLQYSWNPKSVVKKPCFGPKVLQRGPLGSEQPMENVKLSLIGEISPGRRLLGAVHLSEGSSPELLLTSQVRKSWDTLHSSEARCFPPLLLVREQAKELITNQQWLWLPPRPTGTVPCAPLHCA